MRKRTPKKLDRSDAARSAAALIGIVLLLAGCTARHYRESVDQAAYDIIEEKQRLALGRTNEQFTVETAEDQLRQKLLLQQELPRSGPASLGVQYLTPIDHWPNDDFLVPRQPAPALGPGTNAPVVLTLMDALGVAARNSRSYQSSKESVFQSALQLNLERDVYRTTFAGVLDGVYQQDRSGLRQEDGEVVESIQGATSFSATQRLKSGAQLTLQLGWEIIRLLQPNREVTRFVFGDASVSVPLMRGAGRHIVAEPLKQAERNVVYALYDFENFKRAFTVQIASRYLSVLQRRNEVQNVEENYRGLIASTRRARRLLDAGDLPPIQVDQAIQDELSARNRWVSAREAYASQMDSFKTLLGLPADAQLELDPDEFTNLSRSVRGVTEGATEIEYDREIPPADAEIILEEPSTENVGRFELDYDYAIGLALENRLDLRVAEGRIYDALRDIVIAADRLKTEITFLGRASLAADHIDELDPDTVDYEALLQIDLPLERTSEAVAYRTSYLNLEESVRRLQELEDEIKLAVLDRLRILREARESLRIQALSVELARRRVRGAELNLQAGRVEIRDLLEAREDLLSAQNSLTAATVNYRVAELELQRDLGVLEVGHDGLWKEFEPKGKT